MTRAKTKKSGMHSWLDKNGVWQTDTVEAQPIRELPPRKNAPKGKPRRKPKAA